MSSAVQESSFQSGANGTIDVEYVKDIAILRMNRGDNRFNDDFIIKMNEALDKVESNKDIRALITTGNGRFYNNGDDIAWINYGINHDGENKMVGLAHNEENLERRIATFPMITVAAINGHAFGSGASFSLAHDYKVMKSERGWWCLNEMLLGLRFFRMPPLFKLKLHPESAIQVHLGLRFTAESALRHGIVDRVCQGEELLQQATAVARQTIDRGLPSRHNLHAMKCRIYGDLMTNVNWTANM